MQDLSDAVLDAEGRDALQHELKADPEAREAYLDHAQLHKAMQLRAEGGDLLRVVPMEQVNERRQRKFIKAAVVTAAAALVVGGAVMGIIRRQVPPPTFRFATPPGTDLMLSRDLNGGEPPEGARLEPGSSLEIRRGTVEITFASGGAGSRPSASLPAGCRPRSTALSFGAWSMSLEFLQVCQPGDPATTSWRKCPDVEGPACRVNRPGMMLQGGVRASTGGEAGGVHGRFRVAMKVVSASCWCRV